MDEDFQLTLSDFLLQTKGLLLRELELEVFDVGGFFK